MHHGLGHMVGFPLHQTTDLGSYLVVITGYLFKLVHLSTSPTVLTCSGGHWNTYGSQEDSIHPTGMFSYYVVYPGFSFLCESKWIAKRQKHVHYDINNIINDKNDWNLLRISEIIKFDVIDEVLETLRHMVIDTASDVVLFAINDINVRTFKQCFVNVYWLLWF